MNHTAMIVEMLELQDNLNSRTIGSSWRTANKDWRLATAMEAAEALDHLGWKWWSKQPKNVEAAKVEIVDMLHFVLSDSMLYYGGTSSYLAVAEKLHESFVLVSLGLNETPQSLLRYVMARAASPTIEMPLPFGRILAIGELLGMDFLETTRLYRCKCTLNLFRQDNGYKDGLYKKVWDGREDNDHMQELAKDLDWSQGDTAKSLYTLLEDRYRFVGAV